MFPALLLLRQVVPSHNIGSKFFFPFRSSSHRYHSVARTFTRTRLIRARGSTSPATAIALLLGTAVAATALSATLGLREELQPVLLAKAQPAAAAATTTSTSTAAATMATAPSVVQRLTADPTKPKQFITEAATGIQYLKSICIEGVSYDLLGAGCRKFFTFVKVYTMGIYADSAEVESLRSKLKAAKDDSKLDKVMSSTAKKVVLHLKVYREVTAGEIVSSLESALNPRCLSWAKRIRPPGSSEEELKKSLIPLKKMVEVLYGSMNGTSSKVPVGMEIVIVLNPSASSIWLHMPNPPPTAGQNAPTEMLIHPAAELDRAFVDLYLATSGVTPDLRQAVLRALKQ